MHSLSRALPATAPLRSRSGTAILRPMLLKGPSGNSRMLKRRPKERSVQAILDHFVQDLIATSVQSGLPQDVE
jgi:hypothetical protein